MAVRRRSREGFRVVRWILQILHDPKYIMYWILKDYNLVRSCRIFSINSMGWHGRRGQRWLADAKAHILNLKPTKGMRGNHAEPKQRALNLETLITQGPS